MAGFIFYEIGSSCRAEFRMKDGEFHPTEDAVVLGTAEGRDAKGAFEALLNEAPWLKGYRLGRVVARKVGKAVYL